MREFSRSSGFDLNAQIAEFIREFVVARNIFEQSLEYEASDWVEITGEGVATEAQGFERN